MPDELWLNPLDAAVDFVIYDNGRFDGAVKYVRADLAPAPKVDTPTPPNAALDAMREKFETWLTGDGNYPHLKHKHFGGNYLNEEAAMKWDGFKEGYQTALRNTTKECE